MAATKVGIGSGLAFERGRMGRSNSIWKRGGGQDFGILNVREDNNLGDILFTNFLSFAGTAVASKSGNYFPEGAAFHSYEETSCTIKSNADFPVGVTGSLTPPAVGVALGTIRLLTAATAHVNVGLEAGGSANGAQVNGSFALPSSAIVTAPIPGQLPKLYFETRVRFNQLTASSIFLGLAKPGSASGAANGIFTVADVFSIQNLIGLVVNPVATTGLLTSATKIQPVYSADSTALHTPTVKRTGGIPSSADYAGQSESTAVAGLLTDWTKLGFVFDACEPTGVCLRFYQDGVLLASESLSDIVAADWPSDVALNPVIYLQTNAAAAKSLDVDWIAAGQIIEVG